MGEQTDQNLSVNGQLPTSVIVATLAKLLNGYHTDKYWYIIDGFTRVSVLALRASGGLRIVTI